MFEIEFWMEHGQNETREQQGATTCNNKSSFAELVKLIAAFGFNQFAEYFFSFLDRWQYGAF